MGLFFIPTLEDSSEMNGSPTATGLYGMELWETSCSKEKSQISMKAVLEEPHKRKNKNVNFTLLTGQSTENHQKTSLKSKFSFPLFSPLPLKLEEKVTEKQKQEQLLRGGKKISLRVKIKVLISKIVFLKL